MRVLAFDVGAERYLVRLDAVRAVVRLRGLRRLPGGAGALAGVLDVQETTVAIYDTRAAGSPDSGGDVLVLAAGWPDHAVGVACDRVEGLLEVPDRSGPSRSALPSYVEAMMHVDGALIPLVDIVGLAEAGRA
jgi:chemotaxis-related protein WspB